MIEIKQDHTPKTRLNSRHAHGTTTKRHGKHRIVYHSGGRGNRKKYYLKRNKIKKVSKK